MSDFAKTGETVTVPVSVKMAPGPTPLYTYEQYVDAPDCSVLCSGPTNIEFELDHDSYKAGWLFVGYSAGASDPMPTHPNLGFHSHRETTHPNRKLTVFNPALVPNDVHRFSLYYANASVNNGAPFSFDPETQNEGGPTGGD